MMNDLLTTRQVQEILKVERITIYRMLQDGRLNGIKIGQQWRFPFREIERLLGNKVVPGTMSSSDNIPNFPTHCVQTIQDLFSSVAQISAVVLDMQGGMLTRMSRPCHLYTLLASTAHGLQASRSSFMSFAKENLNGKTFFTCFAGLQYIGAPIYDKGIQTGVFLVGHFYWQTPDLNEERLRLSRLATTCGLNIDHLQLAAREIMVIEPQQHAIVENWPYQASLAVQSILQERVTFVERFRQIASLTNVT